MTEVIDSKGVSVEFCVFQGRCAQMGRLAAADARAENAPPRRLLPRLCGERLRTVAPSLTAMYNRALSQSKLICYL